MVKPSTHLENMERNAKQEFELKFKLRMSDKLVRWLIGAILAGGGALTAAAHLIS